MNTRIPIYLMHEEGLAGDDKAAVLSGIKELESLAGVRLEIRDFGVWREPYYKDEGGLIKYQSVDWYIEQGRKQSQTNDQIFADIILDEMFCDPWRLPEKGGEPHYDVMVVNQDMYAAGTVTEFGTGFVIGLASPSYGTIMSVFRFFGLDIKERFECIKTEAMHELGHVFGLPSVDRKTNIEESLGGHCTNRCVMRQGLAVPHDWRRLSEDRLNHGALCIECEKELKSFFDSK